MKIPYGVSDFGRIRDNGYFYADKTPFLPVLENGYEHVVFLRPRRFGKSTLVSMLENYYDLGRKERWDALFGGLWVHDHPTREQSSYLVLTLDFSAVATDAGQDVLRRSFLAAVRGQVRAFLLRYREIVPSLGDLYKDLGDFQDAEALIGAVLSDVSTTPHKIYLLIDEYDHFANRLIAGGEGTMYETVVKKTGFVRTFYATLKAGTRSGAVARMFVTGVSPLMLDDLSSGFNIATHASMSPRLATLAGFTRADTERAVDEFLAARPRLAALPGLGDRGALLERAGGALQRISLRRGRRRARLQFGHGALFPPRARRSGNPPDNMLDQNVRTEYSHLQRIGTLSGANLADRRALLQTILSEGHIRSEIVEQFGVKSLTSHTHFPLACSTSSAC
jgi:hypothetical protein